MRRKLLLVGLGVWMAMVVVVSATPVIAQQEPKENSLEGRTEAASHILDNPKAAENVGENNPAIGEVVHPPCEQPKEGDPAKEECP